MATYIKTNFLIAICAIALTLNFSSCSDDNYINTEMETEETFPDTAEYVFVVGRVTDVDGNSLPNITVEYLIDGEVVSINTNEEGIYEVRDTDTSTERKKIRFHGEGYLPKMDVFFNAEDLTIQKKTILAKVGQFEGGPGNDLAEQSLSDSLISVTGRLINEAGDGIPGVSVVILKLDNFEFVYGVSDEDGNWSIATEETENALVAAYTTCEGAEALITEVSFLEDTELGDLVTNLVQPVVLSFSGLVYDCNATGGLISGKIEFKFPNDNNVYAADVINGSYELEATKCIDADCVDVTIYSYQPASGVDEFECQSYDIDGTVLDFEVCNEPNPTTNGGLLTNTINGETTVYELVSVSEEGPNYVIAAQNQEAGTAVIFITETLENEGTMATAGVLELATQIPIYSVGPNEITYQIDSITTEFMYGSYNGNIINGSTAALVPIEGDFKAKIQ